MDKFMQICSSCNTKFEITDTHKLQTCPKCGVPVKPCVSCRTIDKGEFFDGCKRDCPFKSEYINAIAIYNKK